MTVPLKDELVQGMVEMARKMGVPVVNLLDAADLQQTTSTTQTDSSQLPTGESDNTNTDIQKTDSIDDYIAELILDLVSRKHVKLGELQLIRGVFRNVLKALYDGEPHTFADVRSSITLSKRMYVEKILVKLEEKRIILRVELRGRFFYRIAPELIGSVHQYILNTLENR